MQHSIQYKLLARLYVCITGFKFSGRIFTAACTEFSFETIKVKIVTGQIDSHLNESKYIVPGLGDYGDRFFGSI